MASGKTKIVKIIIVNGVEKESFDTGTEEHVVYTMSLKVNTLLTAVLRMALAEVLPKTWLTFLVNMEAEKL